MNSHAEAPDENDETEQVDDDANTSSADDAPKDDTSKDEGAINESERRYGSDESPA